ncbi:DNA mismatch repair protein MutS [Gemelliphila palaticanis]|uniref:DNA mismatch repair protein MutS n=1 Tax=Gemelliphila palaticanis TaxID=81950 RepID=A0ABX2T0A0_9BACL|nr:DNA mismatch repair protein MutS [Gemella palaticanis]MBF0714869.1 DNA mismatch repair protein MutS [Gemella palaticanis]NYS46799.1 DNA mismatch repair protein MutS [Gemella palaticanis]
MKYTPMIEQYLKIKNQYSDMFLFYRLGDFYELFFDDAINAARILEITLTGREAGVEEKIPMCGVPFHSAANYIEILVNKGHKVAICEQVSEAGQGKLVERKVVQVITPGTYMNYKNYDENNYLGCVYFTENKYYLSFCDIMTGDSRCIELDSIQELYDEIFKNNIKEVLNINNDNLILENIYVTNVDFSKELTLEKTNNISNKNLKISCNHLLDYVEKTQNKNIDSLKDFEIYFKDKFVYLTNYSLKNLEVTQNMANGSKKGSLLSVIDKTKTSSGARKIRRWLEQPLLNKDKIIERQNIIEDFINNYFIRIDIQENLKEIYDLERISSRVSYNIVSPRELLNLKNTLSKIPKIKGLLGSIDSKNIAKINNKVNELSNLKEYLENSIHEDAGQTVKEGNVIKFGFNRELDEYKNAQNNGNNMLLEIEQREKEKTGIKNLKISYNKVFGYFIEISKGNLKNLNVDELGYHRKQTLANCERFVSDELKKVENYIVNSKSKIEELELELFQNIKQEIQKYTTKIQNLADKISDLDVYISLATVAEEFGYVKPIFTEDRIVKIIDGRHPIVERMVSENSYISNDCSFENSDNVLLITGPNMSGKSTYMRQLALIVILAQIGSYVPCSSAKLPIFDKIFTRIGASDDLAGGKSTFMVEMMEAKNALLDSTENSLLIFDEIGRGTSTYDGIALAQSILEYINKNIKCKTLFSTHYHELTKLEEQETGIKNIHVSAKEEKGNLIFLYKVQKGAIEKSYGIHVAKLAGLPSEVITNANKVLNNLEMANFDGKQNINVSEEIKETSEVIVKEELKEEKHKYAKLSFDFDDTTDKYNELKNIIENIDLLNTTPLAAMQIINELKSKVK